jgi:rod shape determining protein RodA
MIGVLMLIDSKFFLEFSFIFYGISIFLLLAALLFGKEINGARAWFEIGSIRIQPAEMAKVATNLALARIMSRFNFKMTRLQDTLKLGLILFLPFVIILLQNDTGSALVYLAFFMVFFREGMSPLVLLFGMVAGLVFVLSLMLSSLYIVLILGFLFLVFLFFYGGRKNSLKAFLIVAVPFVIALGVYKLMDAEMPKTMFLLGGLGAATIFIGIKALLKRYPFVGMGAFLLWGMIGFTFSTHFFFEQVLSDYQRTRILVMLGLEEDPLGAGYNVNQSKIAIGSGGFLGKGFLQGTQTKFDFVPEQSTDFIFCTVGEEWGFVGTTSVLLVFMFLIFRIISLAERQHSDFSRVYGYGVAAIFFFHVAINIGMTIGLAPVIGIPLPFFSYGGSSFWGFTILLFIFLKLDTNRTELIR